MDAAVARRASPPPAGSNADGSGRRGGGRESGTGGGSGTGAEGSRPSLSDGAVKIASDSVTLAPAARVPRSTAIAPPSGSVRSSALAAFLARMLPPGDGGTAAGTMTRGDGKQPDAYAQREVMGEEKGEKGASLSADTAPQQQPQPRLVFISAAPRRGLVAADPTPPPTAAVTASGTTPFVVRPAVAATAPRGAPSPSPLPQPPPQPLGAVRDSHDAVRRADNSASDGRINGARRTVTDDRGGSHNGRTVGTCDDSQEGAEEEGGDANRPSPGRGNDDDNAKSAASGAQADGDDEDGMDSDGDDGGDESREEGTHCGTSSGDREANGPSHAGDGGGTSDAANDGDNDDDLRSDVGSANGSASAGNDHSDGEAATDVASGGAGSTEHKEDAGGGGNRQSRWPPLLGSRTRARTTTAAGAATLLPHAAAVLPEIAALRTSSSPAERQTAQGTGGIAVLTGTGRRETSAGAGNGDVSPSTVAREPRDSEGTPSEHSEGIPNSGVEEAEGAEGDGDDDGDARSTDETEDNRRSPLTELQQPSPQQPSSPPPHRHRHHSHRRRSESHPRSQLPHSPQPPPDRSLPATLPLGSGEVEAARTSPARTLPGESVSQRAASHGCCDRGGSDSGQAVDEHSGNDRSGGRGDWGGDAGARGDDVGNVVPAEAAQPQARRPRAENADSKRVAAGVPGMPDGGSARAAEAMAEVADEEVEEAGGIAEQATTERATRDDREGGEQVDEESDSGGRGTGGDGDGGGENTRTPMRAWERSLPVRPGPLGTGQDERLPRGGGKAWRNDSRSTTPTITAWRVNHRIHRACPSPCSRPLSPAHSAAEVLPGGARFVIARGSPATPPTAPAAASRFPAIAAGASAAGALSPSMTADAPAGSPAAVPLLPVHRHHHHHHRHGSSNGGGRAPDNTQAVVGADDSAMANSTPAMDATYPTSARTDPTTAAPAEAGDLEASERRRGHRHRHREAWAAAGDEYALTQPPPAVRAPAWPGSDGAQAVAEPAETVEADDYGREPTRPLSPQAEMSARRRHRHRSSREPRHAYRSASRGRTAGTGTTLDEAEFDPALAGVDARMYAAPTLRASGYPPGSYPLPPMPPPPQPPPLGTSYGYAGGPPAAPQPPPPVQPYEYVPFTGGRGHAYPAAGGDLTAGYGLPPPAPYMPYMGGSLAPDMGPPQPTYPPGTYAPADGSTGSSAFAPPSNDRRYYTRLPVAAGNPYEGPASAPAGTATRGGVNPAGAEMPPPPPPPLPPSTPPTAAARDSPVQPVQPSPRQQPPPTSPHVPQATSVAVMPPVSDLRHSQALSGASAPTGTSAGGSPPAYGSPVQPSAPGVSSPQEEGVSPARTRAERAREEEVRGKRRGKGRTEWVKGLSGEEAPLPQLCSRCDGMGGAMPAGAANQPAQRGARTQRGPTARGRSPAALRLRSICPVFLSLFGWPMCDFAPCWCIPW